MKLRTLLAFCLLTVSVTFALGGWWPRATPASSGEMVWERLKIGGAGFMPNIDIANDGSRVITTDVSNGFIQRAGIDTQLKPCFTRTSTGETLSLAYGPYATAIAPSDSSVAYFIWSNSFGSGPTHLWRTADGCDTIARVSGITDYPAAFIGTTQRQMGQKIAIDPINPLHVYTCHPTQGVVRAYDGVNFSAVSTSTIPAPMMEGGVLNPGICNGIGFDPTSASTACPTGGGSCTSVLQINVYGKGSWRSTDAGATFSKIAGVGPYMSLPALTVANNNSVVSVIFKTFDNDTRATITDDDGTLIWNERTVCAIGSSNGQWHIRQHWAYVTTAKTLNIKINYNAVLPGNTFWGHAVAIYGADVSGPTPFDTTSSTCGSGAPAITPVSTNAMVYTSQVALGGTPVPTNGNWTCILCDVTSPGGASYTEWTQTTTGGSPITPTANGVSSTRGGFTDAIKATGSGSISTSAMVTTFFTMTYDTSAPQWVFKGQFSPCDGKYYATDVLGGGWKYDGSWTKYTNGFGATGFGAIYPHPTDCGYLLAFGPAAGGMRFVGTSGNQRTSADYGATWSTGSSKSSTLNAIFTDATDLPWYYFTFCCDTIQANYSSSIDAGDGKWNPATLDFEMATGFCAYKSQPPKNNGSYTLIPICQGSEVPVPANIASIRGDGDPVFFSTHDLGMFANLSPTTYPSFGLPINNYLVGLAGCWDVQYTGQPSATRVITAVCNEASGREDTAYCEAADCTKQANWYRLGGSQSPCQTGCVNPTPIGSYTNNAFSGTLAANSCNADNAVFLVGGGPQGGGATWLGGRMFRTENLRTQGLLFNGSVSGTTLTVTTISTFYTNPNGSIQVGQGLAWAGTSGAGTAQSSPTIVSQLTNTNSGGTPGREGTYQLSGSFSLGSQVMSTGPAWIYIPQTDFSGAQTSGNFGWNYGYGTPSHALTNDKDDQDCGTGGTFYVYNMVAQKFYRSTDGGVTWPVQYNGNPAGATDNRFKMYSVPFVPGMLYAASGSRQFGPGPLSNYKLVKTTDGGANWTHCGLAAGQAVYGPSEIALGKPKPGNTNPAVYLLGNVGGTAQADNGIWRSDDDCDTWTRIAPDWFTGTQTGAPQPPNDWWATIPTVIGADFKEYGRVYIGNYPGSGFTQGRIQ